MTDLLFYLFGSRFFAYVELSTDLPVWSNPNSRTGGQPHSDTSPYKAGEYSLDEW